MRYLSSPHFVLGLSLCVVAALLIPSPAEASSPSNSDFTAPQPLDDPSDLLRLPEVGDDIDPYLRFPHPRPPGQIRQLAVANDEVCALLGGGLLLCWPNFEQEVTSSRGLLVAVTAGERHFCGIDSTSRAVCWGEGPATTGMPDTPLNDIAAGADHSCATDTTGRVVCWGRLDAEHRNPPRDSFHEIEAGAARTCAASSWQPAICWGGPARLSDPFDDPVRKLTVSGDSVCGIDGANRPRCAFASGVSAIDSPSNLALDITAGSGFVCTLDTAGSLACEGPNAPELPASPPISSMIESSQQTLCAVTVAGGLRCWDETGELLGY